MFGSGILIVVVGIWAGAFVERLNTETTPRLMESKGTHSQQVTKSNPLSGRGMAAPSLLSRVAAQGLKSSYHNMDISYIDSIYHI